MSDPIIQVENLGKKYTLKHLSGEKYSTLRDVLVRKARHLLGRGRNDAQPLASSEEFWALKDVSFDINRGEVLGVIGRNGAGKSTLLKILSRITEPTVGRVTLSGRVASLLEVGTGFHPELTGRENIFLNGAILGMNKAEIRRKFDEIVVFAEVEKFLDTPVKRYSSGMYVRLAFAVAAHMEPEILIVDEVLAVGDAQFQKKCLGKMEEVSKGGRTVLFVSHNMGTILQLCGRALLFANGSIVHSGTAQAVVESYIASSSREGSATFAPRPASPSITCISVNQDRLQRGDLVVDVSFESPFPLSPPIPGLVLSSALGAPVFASNPRFHKSALANIKSSSGTIRMETTGLPLVGGHYQLSVWLGDWQRDYDEKPNALTLEFKPTALSPMRPNPNETGHLDWSAEWTMLTHK